MEEVSNIFVDATTKKPRPYKEVGMALAHKMSGCAGCHTVDGNKNTGPTWKGVYKSPVKMADGYTMPVVHPGSDAAALAENDKIWDDYLHESILKPDAKVVQGFANVMPSFAAQFSGTPGSVKDEKACGLGGIYQERGRSASDYRPMPTPDHPGRRRRRLRKLLRMQGVNNMTAITPDLIHGGSADYHQEPDELSHPQPRVRFLERSPWITKPASACFIWSPFLISFLRRRRLCHGRPHAAADSYRHDL